MLDQAQIPVSHATDAHAGFAGFLGSRPTPPDTYEERIWRNPARVGADAAKADVLTSRWIDGRTSFRREQATSPHDRYVVSLSLRPTRMRLLHGERVVQDGAMQAGTVLVTAPAQAEHAEFDAACDFLHIYVDAGYMRRQQAANPATPARDLNGFVARDPLAGELGRTLTRASNAGDKLFAQSIGQAIVMRLLALQPEVARTTALPKWRLRRVQAYIAANISEPIGLGDLAAVAGLSRMHFAAQFRAATGYSPHQYLLHRRVECAKEALAEAVMPLAEIALSVGFQTQSHFSTVFKRFTGETPGRWKRLDRCA